jgi:hypothetical protein
MTIETTRAQHLIRNIDRARKDKPTDQTQMLIEIRSAIQDLVRKGLVVDSGQGDGLNGLAATKSCGSLRFSARLSTERRSQKSIGERTNVGCNYKLS